MAEAVESAVKGGTIVWGAPTFDQVWTGWEETRRAVPISVGKFNQSRMEASIGSGRILFRSLDDPDNARSKTADGIVVDEAPLVAEAAWSEVLRPMLMDTGGWFLALGTPKGQNWFWREFIAASELSDSIAWNAPTLGAEIVNGKLVRKPHPLENPNIPFSELEQMFRTMPERVFRQEILAEFMEDAGGVFRDVRGAIDVGRSANESPKPDRSYTMGGDLARIEDYTVLTVFDDKGRQVFWKRFNRISWARQISIIKGVAREYNAPLYIDSTGVGDPIYEQLRKSGVRCKGYTMTNASKEAVIDNLAMGIEQGKLRLMDITEQTNELLAFQYELTPSRNVRMCAPEGMHDDCVIGLALGAWGSQRKRKLAIV